MNSIDLYCKANKRKRNNQYVSVCAHILKAGEQCEEHVYTVDLEANVVKLEILALMNALLDMNAQNRLTAETSINLYINNEYIVDTLIKGLENRANGKPMSYDQDLKYPELWKTIEDLLLKCQSYTAVGLDKKSRGICDEEITSNMGKLNRLVCDKINSCCK